MLLNIIGQKRAIRQDKRKCKITTYFITKPSQIDLVMTIIGENENHNK